MLLCLIPLLLHVWWVIDVTMPAHQWYYHCCQPCDLLVLPCLHIDNHVIAAARLVIHDVFMPVHQWYYQCCQPSEWSLSPCLTLSIVRLSMHCNIDTRDPFICCFSMCLSCLLLPWSDSCSVVCPVCTTYQLDSFLSLSVCTALTVHASCKLFALLQQSWHDCVLRHCCSTCGGNACTAFTTSVHDHHQWSKMLALNLLPALLRSI